MLPSSTGRPGELVVVMDDSIRNNIAGIKLQDYLSLPYPGLPQDESVLKLTLVNHKSFSGFYNRSRNVLLVSIGEVPEKKTYRLTSQRNKWAVSQAVLQIAAISQAELVTAVDSLAYSIIDFFCREDWKRINEGFSKMENTNVAALLKNKFSVLMNIPKEFKLASEDENFAWIRNETEHTGKSIMIYAVPFNSDAALTPDFLFTLRDSVCRKYIPGPSENSFMTTDHEFPANTEMMELNGKNIFVLRGLWKVQGDFMGGPFVQAVYKNLLPGKLLVIEGFVFAPKFDKLEFVRQLEAIIYYPRVN